MKKLTASQKTASGHAPQASAEVVPQEAVTVQRSQAEIFDSAMAAFHQRDFAGAKELFEQSLDGPNTDIGVAARTHLRMCQQRLDSKRPEPQSAEDHYHFAVGLINQRRLAEAESHVRKALEADSKADHYHYALALCRGLQGDLSQAAHELETAIQLDSRNRGIARSDPDFMEFGRHSPVREIIFAESRDGE